MDTTTLIPPQMPTSPEMVAANDDIVYNIADTNLDEALLDQAAERIKRAGEQTIHVDDLDDDKKERSVQLAREILEKLKVQIGDALIEHGLTDLPTAPDTPNLLSDAQQFTDLFDYYISTARAMDDSFMHDPQVLAAIDAADALTYQMVKAAMRAAEERSEEEEVNSLRAHLNMLGQQVKQPKDDTFGELITKMEMGLQKAQARLEAMGSRETFGQSGRSTADAMSIGSHKDSKEKTNKIQASNFNDEYSKQLAARKMARLAVVKQLQAQKAMQRNLRNQKMMMANKDTEPEQKTAKANPMEQLLSPQQIEQMRATMATTLGAAPVEVGTVKDTIKQVKNTQKQQQLVRQQIEQSKRGTHNRQDIQETQVTPKDAPNNRPQKQGRGI